MMVGVLLAAGASTRMGRPKALVRSGALSYLAQGVRHMWTACDSVVVVLGADARRIRRSAETEFERLVRSGLLHDDLEHAKEHGARGLEVRFVVNPRWKRGMLSSVKVGLKEALSLRPEAVLVHPVDHPAVRATTFSDVAIVLQAALAACRGRRDRQRFRYALVPRLRGRRGHPVALSAALARAVAEDASARDLGDGIRRNTRLLGFLDVNDPGVLRNRNTPRD